jgi:hypothetical protein
MPQLKLSQLSQIDFVTNTDLCEVSKDLGGGQYTSSKCTMTQMGDYIKGLYGIQNGSVSASQFQGNPKEAQVFLSSSYSDLSYIITLTGQEPRAWAVVSKTTSSFVISSNSNVPVSNLVYWRAEKL